MTARVAIALILAGSIVAAAADATAPASAPTAETGAAPAFHVVAGELAITQRVDYVLGDPARPFVDADAYRASLALKVVAPGSCALLGVEDYAFDLVENDAGDALNATLPTGAQPCADRTLASDQSQVVLRPGLPLAAHAYHGLRRASGHLVVVWSTDRPSTWTVPLARLKAGPVALPCHPEATLALGEPRANTPETVFLTSPAASLAVIELHPHDANGEPITAPGQRSERRESHAPRPGATGDQVLVFPRALPADAVIEVVYQAAPQRTRIGFLLSNVDFGVTLPALGTIRGSLAHGADEL
jgi:hypothetical protein